VMCERRNGKEQSSSGRQQNCGEFVVHVFRSP
jgi:hypothetical protein